MALFNPTSFVKKVSSLTNPISSISNKVTKTISNGLSFAFPGVSNLVNSALSFDSISKQYTVTNQKVSNPATPDVLTLASKNTAFGGALKRPTSSNTVLREIRSKEDIDIVEYPLNLTNGNKYFLELTFSKYVREYYGVKGEEKFKPNYIALFPLPSALQDAQELGWDTTDGPTGLAMNILQNVGEGAAPESRLSAFSETALAILIEKLNIKPLGIDVAQALSGTLGVALNPFPGSFYTGPKFRQFSFSWQFIPESAAEAERLKSMLKSIRAKTLSRPIGEFGAFLEYPNICRIKLHPSKLEEIFPFKNCALTSIAYDYTPNGLSFHPDSNPTAIKVSMTFAEIQPLFAEDIGGKDYESSMAEDAIDKSFESIDKLADSLKPKIAKLVDGDNE